LALDRLTAASAEVLSDTLLAVVVAAAAVVDDRSCTEEPVLASEPASSAVVSTTATVVVAAAAVVVAPTDAKLTASFEAELPSKADLASVVELCAAAVVVATATVVVAPVVLTMLTAKRSKRCIESATVCKHACISSICLAKPSLTAGRDRWIVDGITGIVNGDKPTCMRANHEHRASATTTMSIVLLSRTDPPRRQKQQQYS